MDGFRIVGGGARRHRGRRGKGKYLREAGEAAARRARGGGAEAEHADLEDGDRQAEHLDLAHCRGLRADAEKDRAEQQEGHDEIDETDAEEEGPAGRGRSEEHTSELQSLMRNSYAVFCLKK